MTPKEAEAVLKKANEILFEMRWHTEQAELLGPEAGKDHIAKVKELAREIRLLTAQIEKDMKR